MQEDSDQNPVSEDGPEEVADEALPVATVARGHDRGCDAGRLLACLLTGQFYDAGDRSDPAFSQVPTEARLPVESAAGPPIFSANPPNICA